MPKISVIMPVYNAELYLREAIDSILAQTYPDFEFIIIDDGSKDRSAEIVRSYKDERIRFYQNERNMGVAATLNRGLDLATGEYIARMDSDDISMPERFEEQVRFLDQNPNIAVCATDIRLFGAQSAERHFSTDPQQLKVDLLFNSCFAHPSVMMRKNIVLEMNGYDPDYNGLEDYELWYRISRKYDLAVLHEVLFRYRLHEKQVTRNPSPEYIHRMHKLKERQVIELGIDPSCEEATAFYDCFIRCKPTAYESILKLNNFFQMALNSNQSRQIYQHDLLKNDFRSIMVNLTFPLPRGEQKKICQQSELISNLDITLNATKRKIKHLIGR